MKDYKEMAQAVFSRRDEYLALQKKKTAALLKTGVTLCSFVLVVVIGVLLWKTKLPDIPVVPAPVEPTQGVSSQSAVQQEPTTHIQVAESTVRAEDPKEPESAPMVPIAPVAPSAPTVSTDPVEKPTVTTPTKPQDTTERVDVTEVTDSVENDAPACSPNDPVCTEAPTMGGFDEYPFPEDTLPMATSPATECPTDPTWGVETTEPTNPTVETEPTEPPTGPLEIIVNGEKCVVQTGDMVSYTAELYVKDLIETFAASVAYSDSLEIIEVINPREESGSAAHYPNLTGGSEMMNYHYTKISEEGKLRAFVSGSKLSGYNFKEQKVLLTFDFIAKSAGEAEIALEIHDLCKKGDGTPYFSNRQQVIFEGIACEEYITVTPAAEVILPTTPNPEPEETVPPFTYPEESYNGELLIYTGERTYSANVGEKVTYVVELEADQKFNYINFAVAYSDKLDLFIPENTENTLKEDFTIPDLSGDGYIFVDRTYTVDGQEWPAVYVDASRLYKFDFRRRKILVQLDFIVAEAGEANIDLIVNTVMINENYMVGQNPEIPYGEAYFYNGEQLISDGINFYEYVAN